MVMMLLAMVMAAAATAMSVFEMSIRVLPYPQGIFSLCPGTLKVGINRDAVWLVYADENG